jgi:hypothetical protein
VVTDGADRSGLTGVQEVYEASPTDPAIRRDRSGQPDRAGLGHPALGVAGRDRGAAVAAARQRPPCFIHRDFQHFNLLWAGGRLTGVVDWSVASSGPPEVDVGHCRLNLAVLFSPDWAERFRLAYEAETGRRTDPWWDLLALAAYRDSWRRFIPIQVGGRVQVDTGGMTARVEDLIESVLGRL